MQVSIPLEAPPIDLEALDLGVERRCRNSQLHCSARGPRNLPATLRQRNFDELRFLADQLLVERPSCSSRMFPGQSYDCSRSRLFLLMWRNLLPAWVAETLHDVLDQEGNVASIAHGNHSPALCNRSMSVGLRACATRSSSRCCRKEPSSFRAARALRSMSNSTAWS